MTSSCNSNACTLSPIPAAAEPVWQLGKHIPHLDGVRGLAILLVTLYRFSKELPTDSWLGHSLHTTFALGDRGVDLFFVLSGFLITGLLIDGKGSANYFVNFFARRSLRIFPLYFAALFLFLVVVPSFAPYRNMFAQAEQQQWYLWTYLTNYKMSLENAWCFGYLDHFWSLAVEEHFYLIWPVVIYFCSLSTALRLACVLGVASAGSRVAVAMFSDNGVAPDVLSVFRFDALLMGSVLAMMIRTPQGLQPLKRWLPWLLPAALTLALACAITERRLFTIAHSLWPMVWSGLLVYLLSGHRQSWLAGLFQFSAFRQLGKYSYAMYVFQSPLIPLTAAVISVPSLAHWTGNAIVGNLLYIGIMFTLTYAAALCSWYMLERHCLKLKKWFPPQQPPGHGRQNSPAPLPLGRPLAEMH